MRWDAYYKNEPQSGQLALSFEEVSMMDEAQAWRASHADEWNYMVTKAKFLFSQRGWVPMKLLIEMTRFWRGVGIKNALSPYFVRIMETEHEELKGAFVKHKSKADEVAND